MWLHWIRYVVNILKALSSGLETTIQEWPKKPNSPSTPGPAGASHHATSKKEEDVKLGVDNNEVSLPIDS